jgi:predicted NAD/FAD-dependent oxidoreductase
MLAPYPGTKPAQQLCTWPSPRINFGDVMQAVRSDLERWFGPSTTSSMKLLKVYRIPFAQPHQEPPTDLQQKAALGEGLYVCGDHRTAATLQGAIESGLAAAAAVLAQM